MPSCYLLFHYNDINIQYLWLETTPNLIQYSLCVQTTQECHYSNSLSLSCVTDFSFSNKIFHRIYDSILLKKENLNLKNSLKSYMCYQCKISPLTLFYTHFKINFYWTVSALNMVLVSTVQ